jgi:hypothetical protein
VQELAFDPKEQESVRIEYGATLTGAWTTHNPDALAMLTAFHALGPDFLDRHAELLLLCNARAFPALNKCRGGVHMAGHRALCTDTPMQRFMQAHEVEGAAANSHPGAEVSAAAAASAAATV